MKRTKRCMVRNCSAVAPFASPANPDVHACEEHKKRDFVNMRNKRCLAVGCCRNPHYGVSRAIDPNSKAQFCTVHKSQGMENVNGGRCAGPKCSKQPRFAMPGSKGKFCSNHREEGMVDVLYTPCATAGCIKHPHFGYTDGGPRYCAQHRAEDMVDVKHRRCAIKGCRKDRLQMPIGPRKRGKFCEVHHTSEKEDELFAADQLASTERVASSPSHRQGESDGHGKRGEMLPREIGGDTAAVGSTCVSFLPLYHLGPREEDSYSDQPPLQAVRDLMTKAAYPPSDDPPRLPSFVFNARTQPTRVAWFGEAPVEPRSSRSGGNPYAVSYLDKPAATSSDHIALTIDDPPRQTARSEHPDNGSPGARFACLEPAASDPYPLFSRRGYSVGYAGDESRSTNFGDSGDGFPSSLEAPCTSPREAAKLRPFRLQVWRPSPYATDGAAWYPCPFTLGGGKTGSESPEGCNAREFLMANDTYDEAVGRERARG